MKKSRLVVKTKSKKYPIYFTHNKLSIINTLIKKNLPGVKKICLISDKKIPKELLKILIKSLNSYELKIYKLLINEKTKTLKTANKITEDLLKNNFNRSDCVISFGGGIVGDLSGFIASVIKFINIPTTLLAQADASIGGKTGINSNQGKNLIGTFYQPDFVLSDTFMLNSLSNKEMICGYGEILKHSLISSRQFFLWLFKNGKKIINSKDKIIIKKALIKSCKIKSQIVNQDEKEKNKRMVLNFGHTFAHGLEGAAKFSKKVSHGEAVLLGMVLANQLSYDKKILPLKDLILIQKHYFNLNLPSRISKFFKKNDINKIISFMERDKKNFDKKINLILLKKIGSTIQPNSFNVSGNELKKFLLHNYQ